jgi:PhzF family phenazine biosynthesis protein
LSPKIYQVDSFTEKPFKGNPAGVCILSEPKDDPWMLKLANEMNLSETAFLLKVKDGYQLRWFTPEVEVDLCGHATLATAHILWSEAYVDNQTEINFFTRSGVLTAKNSNGWIELDFPAKPQIEENVPEEVIKALKIKPLYSGRNKSDYLIEVESEETVTNLKPNFELLKLAPVRAVIVTSKSTTHEYDFISRFFAPSVGVNEDPVTGSAHCCLGPYWSHKLGKSDLIGYQASKRSGIIKVKVQGDRVVLCGRAVTIFKGELVVDSIEKEGSFWNFQLQ